MKHTLLAISSFMLVSSFRTRICCDSLLIPLNRKQMKHNCVCPNLVQSNFNIVKYSIYRKHSRCDSSSYLSAAVSHANNQGIINNNETPYKLVIVESPAKAKTIEKILTSLKDDKFPENDKGQLQEKRCFSFQVEPCYGHIRDLPTSAKYVPEKFKSHPWSTLGVDVENNFAPLYIPLPGKENLIDRLCSLVYNKNCLEVILATDEDREGEAISWHLHQLFLERTKKNLPPPMRRIKFNEITPRALDIAFSPTLSHDYDGKLDTSIHQNGSENEDKSHNIQIVQGLNMNLVEAQECRRIVDRLAGYSMSPVLWKKITPGLSAGRVQTVGLHLVVQRELDRMRFKSSEYWDLAAYLHLPKQDEMLQPTAFLAKLSTIQGLQIASSKDFNGTTGLLKEDASQRIRHLTEKSCKEFQSKLRHAQWVVQSVASKQIQRSPPLPFMTSTLQQEANTRLGFSVSETMSTAQVLYEAGYISYMRTDSSLLSDDARKAAKVEIQSRYGKEYLAAADDQNSKRKEKKRRNRSDTSTVEKAHEAIRPAIYNGRFVEPAKLDQHYGHPFSTASKQLYELIYRRTCASQMREMVQNQTSVSVLALSSDLSTEAVFTASGSVILFDGFTRAFSNEPVAPFDAIDLVDFKDGNRNCSGSSSNINDSDESWKNELPKGIVQGAVLSCYSLESLQHHTNPPARFNEATFVRELERNGVGRPSTYAIIISTLRSRAYVGTPTKQIHTVTQQNRNAVHGSRISAQRAAGGAEFMGANRGPLVPSITSFAVCSLLERYCPTFVNPAFTSEMESKLDIIAKGIGGRLSYLSEYYNGEHGLKKNVTKMMDEIDAEDARRVRLPALEITDNDFIPRNRENSDSSVGLFIGPWGPYVQRISDNSSSAIKKISTPVPIGIATNVSSITKDLLVSLLHTHEQDGIILGALPENAKNVRLKVGRFGAYLQVGETGEKNTTTHTIPRKFGGMGGRQIKMEEARLFSDSYTEDSESMMESNLQLPNFGMTLEQAIGYANLPRKISEWNGSPVMVGLGRYGPYLIYNNSFFSIPHEVDVLNIGEEMARKILEESILKSHSNTNSKSSVAFLGEKESGSVEVCKGRFGYFIKWKTVNAKLPVKYHENPSYMPVDEAWSIIQEKLCKNSQPRIQPGKKKRKEELAAVMPPKPKRPLTSYLLFCADKRLEVMDTVKTLGEVSKELSRQWSTLEDKSFYENKAVSAKKIYEEKKRIWEEECKAIECKYLSGSSKKSKVTRRILKS